MNFSGKKLLLLGFVLVLLLGIPVTLYLVQQQQDIRQRASKSTTLSMEASAASINVNENVSVNVMINPGTNLASFVKMEVEYDPTKLSIDSATGFSPNPTAFPVTVEGPSFTPGKMIVSLSIGANTTQAITSLSKVGTLTFKALAPTNGEPTTVSFGTTTQVLSTGTTDQATEDILSTTVPAKITINGGTGTVTPTATPSASITVTPTFTPTPTTITVAPTTPVASGSGQTPNQPPTCTALNLDRSATGVAPYSLTFTAIGNDTDGTVSKVSFNFGDGPVQNNTDAGGIGSNTVSSQIAHTYANAGTYQAYVLLTDNSGAISNYNTCKTTITITSADGGTGTTVAQVTTAPAETPVTGPSTLIMIGGALTGILSVIGAVAFFIL